MLVEEHYDTHWRLAYKVIGWRVISVNTTISHIVIVICYAGWSPPLAITLLSPIHAQYYHYHYANNNNNNTISHIIINSQYQYHHQYHQYQYQNIITHITQYCQYHHYNLLSSHHIVINTIMVTSHHHHHYQYHVISQELGYARLFGNLPTIGWLHNTATMLFIISLITAAECTIMNYYISQFRQPPTINTNVSPVLGNSHQQHQDINGSSASGIATVIAANGIIIIFISLSQ